MLDAVRSLGRRRLEPRDIGEDVSLAAHLPYVTALRDDVLMLRDGGAERRHRRERAGRGCRRGGPVGDRSRKPRSRLYAAPGLDPRRATPRAAAPRRSVLVRGRSALAGGARLDAAARTQVLRHRDAAAGEARRCRGAAARPRRQRRARPDRAADRAARRGGGLPDGNPRGHPARAPHTLGGGRWLELLGALVTGRAEPMPAGKGFRPLADLVANSSLRFKGDQFVVPGG